MADNEGHSFTIKMKKIGAMKFEVEWDKEQFPTIYFDEPPNAGGNDEAPNASRYLTAAVMNCLSASLTFCLKKARIPLDALESEATCTIARNDEGYWRIKEINVKLKPYWKEWSEDMQKSLDRCSKIFMNYCIVSASVKQGIPINVIVERA